MNLGLQFGGKGVFENEMPRRKRWERAAVLAAKAKRDLEKARFNEMSSPFRAQADGVLEKLDKGFCA